MSVIEPSHPAQSVPAPLHSVVVVGSANVDLLVRVAAHPGPGETVLASGLTRSPGGKGANQAVAAARLGASVTFVGAIGQDAEGRRIVAALEAEGVRPEIRTLSDLPSGIALVSIDDHGENSITVVAGANAALGADEVSASVASLGDPGDLVVVQGELAPATTAAAIAAADDRGARVVVNLAPFWPAEAGVLTPADPLVVNETEAGQLLGSTLGSAPGAARAAAQQLALGSRSVVITLGADGAVWADAAGSGEIAAEAAPRVVDTTGAGDAFVGALAASLAGGASLPSAVERGVRAGTFAVGGLGAQTSYARPADLPPVAVVPHDVS